MFYLNKILKWSLIKWFQFSTYHWLVYIYIYIIKWFQFQYMLANKKINGFILLFFISYKRFQHASNKKIGKSMYSDFINILKGLISNCSGA
jgi:hypothetical protein